MKKQIINKPKKHKKDISAVILKVINISRETVVEMHKLMRCYYDNLLLDNFSRDLYEKEWVIILKNEKENVVGFTTIMLIDINTHNEKIKCVFSGDTVIDKNYWGMNLLPVVWGKFVIHKIPEKFPNEKIYWILISKGYKTYRLMATHFISFYPCYYRVTPSFEKTIIDEFGRLKYPEKYDPVNGIIFHDDDTDKVKRGVADIKKEHLNDPHIDFFMKNNSNFMNGDELVCIADLSYNNIKPESRHFLYDNNNFQDIITEMQI